MGRLIPPAFFTFSFLEYRSSWLNAKTEARNSSDTRRSLHKFSRLLIEFFEIFRGFASTIANPLDINVSRTNP